MSPETIVSGRASSEETQGSPRLSLSGVQVAAFVFGLAGLTAWQLLGSPVAGVAGLLAIGAASRAKSGVATSLVAIAVMSSILGGRNASDGFGSNLPVPLLVGLTAVLLLVPVILSAARQSASFRRLLLIVIVLTLAGSARLALDVNLYGFLAFRDWIVFPAFVILAAGAGIAFKGGADESERNRIARIGIITSSALTVLYVMSLVSGVSLGAVEFGNIGVAGAALITHGLYTRSVRQRLMCLALGGLGVAFSQSRMIYLVLGLVLLLALTTQTRGTRGVASGSTRVLSLTLFAAITLILLSITATFPQLQGRLGQVSVSAIRIQLSSVFSSQDSTAGSVGDRRIWWSQVLAHARDNPHELLTGRGVGPDLINGYLGPDGELVRKPHNDYLETMARVGLIPSVLLLLLVLGSILIAIRLAGRDPYGGFYLGWLLAAAATAFAQPYFAYPHAVVPFAIYAGIVCVRYEQLRDTTRA